MALQPVSMFQHDDNPKHTVNAKKKKKHTYTRRHTMTLSVMNLPPQGSDPQHYRGSVGSC